MKTLMVNTIYPAFIPLLFPEKEYVILEDNGWDKVFIQFVRTGTTVKVQRNQLKQRGVSDPMKPSVWGVGYRGIGHYNFVTAKESFIRWRCMLNRCYGHSNKVQSAYKGCIVCDEWLNFQNFSQWFYENYIEGWVLDKDILVRGNKIYSPDTCCFVPVELNSMFTKSNRIRGNYPIGVTKQGNKYLANIFIKGTQKYLGSFSSIEEAFTVYKKHKEDNIKRITNEIKSLISERLYNVLINYEVLITD